MLCLMDRKNICEKIRNENINERVVAAPLVEKVTENRLI